MADIQGCRQVKKFANEGIGGYNEWVNAKVTNRRKFAKRDIVDIPPNVQDGLGRLFSARSEVAKVIVFGSRARGDAGQRSDVDLAIVAPKATPRQWLDIVFALKDMDTLLSIDVVRWAEASPALKARIAAEGKVLYERRGVISE